MKRKILFPVLLAGCFSLFSTQCDSDDDGNAPIDNSADITAIIATAEEGTWRVSSYIDDGQDETSDYNGFAFTFGTNGTLTATNGNVTKTGTWSVTDDSNSSDDDDSDVSDIDFNIFFSVPETDDFEDLVDDWDVLTYSNTQIQLRDVSGGDGSIDTLTFTKI